MTNNTVINKLIRDEAQTMTHLHLAALERLDGDEAAVVRFARLRHMVARNCKVISTRHNYEASASS